MQRLGDDVDVFVAEVVALELQQLRPPGPFEDFDALSESLRAIAEGDAVPGEVLRVAGSSDAAIDPAATHHVEDGELLGQSQRVVQGQQVDGETETNPLRALRGAGRHQEGRRHHRIVRLKMQFSEPGGVVAESVGKLDLRQRVAIARRRDLPRPGGKLVERPELHRSSRVAGPARRATPYWLGA